jgi:3-oxoacyl-[acyl-carrier protein] reductase
MSDIRLDDKVVIVTGASQGLGRTMAIGLAGAGARLVITSIDGPNLAETAEEIADHEGHGRALALEADINERSDCERVLEETLATFGGLHVLVNNARRLHRGHPSASGPFWKADHEYWRSAINTNVGGSFLMAHTMTPHMIDHGWGRIVNISTSINQFQRANASPYGVSKAAIEAETMIWAKDLEDTGVTVNTLLPGGSCDTGVPGRTGRPGQKLLPPRVMVAPIIWLASDLSDGVTAARFIGKDWDTGLAAAQAAEGARDPSPFRVPD